jgi:hypothetical protein
MSRNIGAGLVGAFVASVLWVWLLIGQSQKLADGQAQLAAEQRAHGELERERIFWHEAYSWALGFREFPQYRRRQLADFLKSKRDNLVEELHQPMSKMINELEAD